MKKQDILLDAITATARAITQTPISDKPDNGSLQNWLIEQDYLAKGYNAMWTDAPENLSRKGDLFAFVKGAGTKMSNPCFVDLHRIVAILPNNCNRPDWVKTCNEHKITESVRNVLVLSPLLYRLNDWEIYAEAIRQVPYSLKPFGNNADPQRSPVQRTVSVKIS
jgi:hypothetical protein